MTDRHSSVKKRPNGSAPSDPAAGSQKARLLTGAAFPATSIVCTYFNKAADAMPIMGEIQAQIHAVQSGDLSSLEGTLTAQAIGLNAMFCDLANRAKQAGSLAEVQALTQLALKAQSGARATIQAIAEVKMPRQVAFVQQANIATHQQINTHAPAREKMTRNAPNKLIAQEPIDGRTQMDNRAKEGAGRPHPPDPAVAPRHRTNQRRG